MYKAWTCFGRFDTSQIDWVILKNLRTYKLNSSTLVRFCSFHIQFQRVAASLTNFVERVPSNGVGVHILVDCPNSNTKDTSKDEIKNFFFIGFSGIV